LSDAGQSYPAGRSTDFSEGVLVARSIAGVEVIFARVGGRVVCFLDQCAHQPVKLSEFGEIRSGVLVCHAHGGGFDLDRGGNVLCGPPKEPLKAFKCQEENGEVSVIID